MEPLQAARRPPVIRRGRAGADHPGGCRMPIVLPLSAIARSHLGNPGLSGRLLHHGISQLPFAVETAFPVGPIEVVINRETMQAVDQRHAYRPNIKKPSGAEVPTDSFLNPEYASVSAILGTPAGVNAACGNEAPIALVHNPLATNLLPVSILGADEEYVAEDEGDHYELHIVG